jgi:hypothetical protein
MSRLLIFSITALLALLGALPLSAVEAEDLESQFEQDAEGSSDSDHLEWLLFLEKHPLDMNQATVPELTALPYLSSEEATAIVTYRERIGKFEKTDDLLKVEGLDADQVNLLKRYLTVAPLSPPHFHAEASLKLKRQTPRPTGFSALEDSSRYLGNDLWLRNGIRLSYGESYRLILGTFKGSGEPSYADAVVAGAEWKTGSTRLLLGNYALGFGQGLAFGRLHGFSRFSGKLAPSGQSVQALRLYQASTPGTAFFGLAGQASMGSFTFTAFGSRQALDATRDPQTGSVRTILTTGEHRSLDEKAKQAVLREEMGGGRLEWARRERLSLGVTGCASRDNPSLSPERNERRVYDFRGARNSVLAADGEITLGKSRFFAEAGQSYGGGNAGVLGGLWAHRPWAFSLTAWHYDPDFHNRYSNGPCHSEPRNETGALLMGKGRLPTRTRLFGYYEGYRHPWRRYYEAFPTAGYEAGGELTQALGRSLEVSLRRKASQSEENVSREDGTSFLQPSARYLMRYEGLWQASPRTSLRLRYEQVRSLTGEASSRGTSLGFAIRHKLGKTWRLASTLSVFHTDSYDSRLYQWEEDLPGVLTNSAIYGRGRKAALYLEGNLLRYLTCSLRYANTYYYHQAIMGTGPDSRPGNLAQEFGLGIASRP